MNFIVYKLNLINVDEILDVNLGHQNTLIRYKCGAELRIGVDFHTNSSIMKDDAKTQTEFIINLIIEKSKS